MSSRLRHPLTALFGGIALTLPWILSWLTGVNEGFSTLTTVGVAGVAVLGASFLLAWGAETAEKDVPRAFAIAVLAVLAVAPEYAVDALYAWQAGQGDAAASNLAVANMTGANRILIGIGWSGIALFSVYRAYSGGGADPNVVKRDGFLRDYVDLDRDISLEIAFLFLATVFAFFVPLGGGIGAIDTIVLVGLYLAYILVIIRGDVEEVEEQVGVPAYFQARARSIRIPVVLGLFTYSGLLIFTAVEPFAHGLEALGLQFGIPEFFMIQWIAPLASESPELIVTAYLVNKARSTAAFNALISSKLNQWTLLIGTLVVVYSISLGQYGVLMFDEKQASEIWITAAQSLFALAILINFQISVRESLLLLVLFLSQVITEFYFIRTMSEAAAEANSILLLDAFTVFYLVISVGLLAARRDQIREVATLTGATVRDAVDGDAEQPAD
ncbi:sodium:calcium antiporter [Halobaculum sp. CBA1158]|uniref:sodium:calcium antiporter n=1 Tax=Halobaculum sp. CBA1158 TaxID=2904243 RepID=UPI001F3BC275|nr:sodium:calcium antiporter [Halobaculum sp. CBA1158]UIP00213.1 sodium:calcium antiporter [Halobaculum sp. CBA1158]